MDEFDVADTTFDPVVPDSEDRLYGSKRQKLGNQMHNAAAGRLESLRRERAGSRLARPLEELRTIGWKEAF